MGMNHGRDGPPRGPDSAVTGCDRGCVHLWVSNRGDPAADTRFHDVTASIRGLATTSHPGVFACWDGLIGSAGRHLWWPGHGHFSAHCL